eukprot:scaffold137732_cov214-Phaeocystis_antarctica.AAC.1
MPTRLGWPSPVVSSSESELPRPPSSTLGWLLLLGAAVGLTSAASLRTALADTVLGTASCGHFSSGSA